MALRRYFSGLIASLLNTSPRDGRAELALTLNERRTLGIQLFVLALVLLLGVAQYVSAGVARRSKTTTSCKVSLAPIEKNVARVHSLFLYPVKSCAPIKCSHLPLTYKGFELDRRWCFLRRKQNTQDHVTGVAGDWEKITLKTEPRLALIQPSLSTGAAADANADNAGADGEILRLAISPYALAHDASLATRMNEQLCASTPARPTDEMLRAWPKIDQLDMYGDPVQGRVVASASSETQLEPSQWMSRFLGYEVKLVYFDRHAPGAQRPAWPWYLPRSSAGSASGSVSAKDASEGNKVDRWSLALERGAYVNKSGPGKGVEFQDEYPLLVTSVESMAYVQSQLQDAIAALTKESQVQGSNLQTDGRGGRPFAGLEKVAHLYSRPLLDTPATLAGKSGEAAAWEAAITATPAELEFKRHNGDPLSILRFRPNVVIASSPTKSASGSAAGAALPPFVEEQWETMWLHPYDQMKDLNSCNNGDRGSGADEDTVTAHINLVTYCERCTITTLDPVTGEFDRAGMPLKLIARSHAKDKKLSGRKMACFGLYAVPLPLPSGEQGENAAREVYGELNVGDSISVRHRPVAPEELLTGG
ncbi:hypothetical protein K437DRAFT_252983 [Tilletiaria anomala UBC 951]|uniref:MOSC domain-containing protein n=1 Tax=Tilletiaria anomala (strain ATCC 24038 / CBS 436.72 / UBC 951) TaxID=1037660 RepID=A0A066WHX3_TILAU|nr:uncharacterized protein K437DRAFT_252983 [Tilletiaria anomala UBC 951]KDN53617.1 hypothetical protein K437DRAFT_252983 [Tilletiaria anomala UBC 951]